uniref:Uncharacterized protein n=1 Tax=Rhipicephalus zambeziensis TaxID=60191 RepID=A0A224YGQ8_9ACAR
MAMYACTMQYYCDITCCIVTPVYRTRVFVKHESYFHCISKQRKLFSLYFQAEVWLCGRTPACHADGLGSILTRTRKFLLFILFASFSIFRSRTR